MRVMKQLFEDDVGATAIEYGLIAALVALLIIGGLTTIGGELRTTFNSVATGLQGANQQAPSGDDDD